MLYVFDIDGTLGKGFNGYSYYLNEHLELGLSQDTLAELKNYWAFTQLPTVQAFVQNNPRNQERYLHAYKEAQHDPGVQESLVPTRDAVSVVNQLAKAGKVIYATCRKQESKGLTQSWLARHGFPCSEQVYICDHYHFKYVAAYDAADPDEYIFLFDDHAEDVIRFFASWRAITHILP
ncbi:HAD hydrolase-like protein [Ktedonobacter robiniae]|uniref:Nucleotidase n=1 Tax=Ktedonobacter robiniae TaxID=2778365 RepID=A0ABQ3V252_9CHLR|nr:HAD hydrolase-like protein [Ktedonobacter robiniae]GHO59241.1 hypothetical protein KSB_77160 [Ktedonobacter robiniae]